MITPTTIDHIVLRTDRYQALIDFYCQILGCSLERQLSAEFGLTQLRAGNALIDIVDVNGQLGQTGGPAPKPVGNNVDHFCLQIEKVEEGQLIAFLKENAVDCSEFKERYGAQGMGRSIYIKDCVGNQVELRFSK